MNYLSKISHPILKRSTSSQQYVREAITNTTNVLRSHHVRSYRHDVFQTNRLHHACHESDEYVAKKALAFGADINSINDYGFSPLHIALQFPLNTRLCTLLLHHGSNPNQPIYPNEQLTGYIGYTPLMLLTERHEDAQNYLDAHEYPIEYKLREQLSFNYMAIQLIDRITQSYPMTLQHIDPGQYSLDTPQFKYIHVFNKFALAYNNIANLRIGFYSRYEELMRLNLKNESDFLTHHCVYFTEPDNHINQVINHYTPLQESIIAKNHFGFNALILDKGIDVNKSEHNGTSPLNLAIQHNCLDFAQQLLRHPNISIDALHLHTALRQNNTTLMNELLVHPNNHLSENEFIKLINTSVDNPNMFHLLESTYWRLFYE